MIEKSSKKQQQKYVSIVEKFSAQLLAHFFPALEKQSEATFLRPSQPKPTEIDKKRVNAIIL